MGQDAAGVAGQDAQQIELLARQFHQLLPKAHLVARKINSEVSDRDRRLLFLLGATRAADAQQGADPRQQLGNAERLDDVIVGAGVQCRDLLALSLPHGKDQDGDAGPFANAPDDVLAVEIGQSKIENDEIGRVGGRVCDALAAGRGFADGEPMRLECDAQEPADLRLVVDDEDGLRAHDRWAAVAAGFLAGGSESESGRWISIRVPVLSLPDRARILPPCASKMPRLMARPNPVPLPCRSPLPTR
jgi:hypothetical protein